ncbi:MAG: hypothetical protein JXR88_13955 [Clostridia bacterium]|nr:hypothetical protein [Clostridia bacterium]
MESTTKLPKLQLWIILIVASVLILFMSLDTLIKVKDITLYDTWYNEMITSENNLSYDDAFSVYVTGNTAVYFLRIIVPMALGIHTYFAYSKIRINKLFVFIWVVLLIGNTAYIAVTREYHSLLYYINLILHGVLIVTVLSLSDVINQHKIK